MVSEPEPAPRISGERFCAMVRESIGLGSHFDFECEGIRHGWIRLRLPFHTRYLRPGDAISGPTVFTLADTALFGAVLSMIGEQPMAVTADMNLHFLRRAGRADLIAEARILKLGRRLAVGEVSLHSGDDPRTVAHAVGSYALPGEPT
jgi:uncharacterized protein (TIGR00369 family)